MLIGTCPEEVAVAAFAPELRRCIRLLEALDSLGGHAAAQWGDVRVQGGDHAAQAEKKAGLVIELEKLPPRLVTIAERLRGYRPETSKGKYISGLLNGLSGEDLRRATGLSDRKMGEHRRWLRSVVKACGVV